MKLTVDAEILKAFAEGKRLFIQFKDANWERKTYIANHFERLIKMLRNYATLSSRVNMHL